MRKLASIQIIEEIKPIDKADAIEAARVNFSNFVKYDETSKSCLRVISKYNRNVEIGQELGSVKYKNSDTISGWRISINSRYYNAHYIVWNLLNGEIPEGCVCDHIDGNPLNNKISNLRMVVPTINNKNRKKLKNNTTGYTGIIYSEITNRNKVYRYYIGCFHNTEGKEIRKYFSCLKFGDDCALEMAIQFRKNGLQFSSDYTERHGK